MIGSLDPDAPIITFSSLSKAYLAPGWRAGWMGIGRSPRLDDVVKAVGKLADARLCSTLPMQYADPGGADRRPIAPGGVSRGAQGAGGDHDRAAQRHSWRELRGADGCVLRDAARDAAARQDRRGLRLALLRATGVLCVYGSGFGTRSEDGYFRIVFLASPAELERNLRPDGGLHQGVLR